MDSVHVTSVALGVCGGLCLGWLLRARLRPMTVIQTMKTNSAKGSEGCIMSDNGEFKLVLVVRNDLKMGKGKVAAQCSHASVGCVKKLYLDNPALLQCWEEVGQPKVVVKTDSEESLLELAKQARSVGLNYQIIRDAGRTQITPGSKTVLGVGPGPADLIDKVTGHLKLF